MIKRDILSGTFVSKEGFTGILLKRICYIASAHMFCRKNVIIVFFIFLPKGFLSIRGSL